MPKIRCFRLISAMGISLWSTFGQLLRYFKIQEDRLHATWHIQSHRFTLRYFRHCFRDSLTTVQIVLLECMWVNPQCHIRTCMTRSLSCVCNTDTSLQLQAHRCMTEHMRMNPRQSVLLCKAVQSASRCCRIQEWTVFLYRKENCVIIIVPFFAVLLSRFTIESLVFSEHIHDTAIQEIQYRYNHSIRKGLCPPWPCTEGIALIFSFQMLI